MASTSLLARLAAPALAAALLATGIPAPAQAGRLRAVAANPDGGVTAVTGVARRGPHGGRVLRAGSTSVNADGSAAHQGRFHAANARGSVTSSGSASRDGAGNASAARETTVTSAATGNSAQIDSSYSRSDGTGSAQRSVTCYDAAGNTIACR